MFVIAAISILIIGQLDMLLRQDFYQIWKVISLIAIDITT